MRFHAGAMLALLVAPLAAQAQGDFLSTQVIDAVEAREAPPARPSDPFWAQVTGRAVPVAPQKTVRLNDRIANEKLDAAAPYDVVVKAAVGGGKLGLWVEWPDAAADRTSPDETSAFGDSVAMQVPRAFGKGKRLPYIGMGDDANPVVVAMQRAIATGAQTSTYIAAGFGSLTRTAAPTPSATMEYDTNAHRWRAVFLRPLADGAHSLDAPLFPVAFAVWDGAGRQRGGAKALSGWRFVRRAGRPLDDGYVKELSWGYGAPADLAKGKALVESVCIACHRVGDKRFAPEGLAPGLDGIGAIAAPSYLRDAILDPSAVIVPDPNVNRHYNKGATPDANGAYPNNPSFQWSATDATGKKLSKMPAFAHFSADDVAAMVAYLRTLDGTRKTP